MQVLQDDLLDPNKVSKNITELGYRSRHNNLRLDGLTEDPNETWGECERKVQEVLFNNLNIDGNIEVARCHRYGKRRGSRPWISQISPFQRPAKNSSECEETKGYKYEDS